MTTATECRTLWMGDIQPNWNEEYIGSLFAELGEDIEVKLIRDKVTGYLSGYGFVEFKSHGAAKTALERYNGQLVAGTAVRYRLNWGAGGQRIESPPEYSIFVGDLGAGVTDVALRQIFAAVYDSVLGAKIVTDLATGTSKGFGFVRFSSEADRDAAFSMHGTLCMGRPIRVAPATKRAAPPPNGVLPDAAAHDAHAADANAVPGGDLSNTTIFVGGLSDAVDEDALHAAFEGAGKILYVKIPPGRGCGFVSFAERGAAEGALRDLQGMDVIGCKVRLSWGKSHRERATAALGAPPIALTLDPLLGGSAALQLASHWGSDSYGTPGSYGMDSAGGMYGFDRGGFGQGGPSSAQHPQPAMAYYPYAAAPHYLGYGLPQSQGAPPPPASHHAQHSAPAQHAMLLSQAQQRQQQAHIMYMDGSAAAAAAAAVAAANGTPSELGLGSGGGGGGGSYMGMYSMPAHSSPVMMPGMQSAFPVSNGMDGGVGGLHNGGGTPNAGMPGDGGAGMLGGFPMNVGYRTARGLPTDITGIKATMPGHRAADGWRAVALPRGGGNGGGRRGGGGRGGAYDALRRGGSMQAEPRSKSRSPNPRHRGGRGGGGGVPAAATGASLLPPPPVMVAAGGGRGASSHSAGGMGDMIQAAQALSLAEMDAHGDGVAVASVGPDGVM